MLVQNNIFTAEAPRTRRKNFLFGGEVPPNKKLLDPILGICGRRPGNLWKIGISRFSIKFSFSVSSVSRTSHALA
jgi:hypothetical protein